MCHHHPCIGNSCPGKSHHSCCSAPFDIHLFRPFATSSSEANRLNRAVLSYDVVYMIIAVAATLLFIFETSYRVYNLYTTTNSGRRRRRGGRKKREIMLPVLPYLEDQDELCQRIFTACWKLNDESQFDNDAHTTPLKN